MAFVRAKKRGGKTYYYLVEGKREGDKVKQKVIKYLGTAETMKSGADTARPTDITVKESLDYGAVVALHTIAERLQLADTIYRSTTKGGGTHIGKLVEIMTINRCIKPVSKRGVKDWYSRTALPFIMDVQPDEVHHQILYNALDYLDDKSILKIQKKLFQTVNRIYGIDKSSIFYDLTSTFFEGTKCPIARFGHSTDHRPDKLQINIGVGVDRDCIPITHNVFEGNVRDVSTVDDFSKKLKDEFGLKKPIIVIDRGMISDDNLKHLLEKKYHYIVARKMLSTEKETVWDIPDEEYIMDKLVNISEEREIWFAERKINGKRWIVYSNKQKADDDKQFRDLMVEKTRTALENIKGKCGKRNLKTKEAVYHKTYNVLEKYKTKKCFNITINERGAPKLKFEIKEDEIEKASKLDGKFILETSDKKIEAIDVIRSYRDRDVVEKFFQAIKNVVELRPVYVYTTEHVKAHVFICVLAVLLLSILRKVLREAGKTMTAVKALGIIDGIKRVEFCYTQGTATIVKTTEFSDEQREIISILNVAPMGL